MTTKQSDARHQTVVLEVGGMKFASEKHKVESHFARLPGVVTVDANPVSQTARLRKTPVMITGEAACHAA